MWPEGPGPTAAARSDSCRGREQLSEESGEEGESWSGHMTTCTRAALRSPAEGPPLLPGTGSPPCSLLPRHGRCAVWMPTGVSFAGVHSSLIGVCRRAAKDLEHSVRSAHVGWMRAPGKNAWVVPEHVLQDPPQVSAASGNKSPHPSGLGVGSDNNQNHLKWTE